MLMHRSIQKSGNLEDYQTARLSRLPNLDDEILSIYGFTLSWSKEFLMCESAFSITACSCTHVYLCPLALFYVWIVH